jgi:hypothetical protein
MYALPFRGNLVPPSSGYRIDFLKYLIERYDDDRDDDYDNDVIKSIFVY